MKELRVALANPHHLIRSNLRKIIERDKCLRVIGEASDALGTALLVETHQPDVLILDVQLLDTNGIAVARRLSGRGSGPAILFVSLVFAEEYVIESVRAGARGFVSNDCASDYLIEAVKKVGQGGFFLSPTVSSRLIEAYASDSRWCSPSLTAYQKDLFCALAQGKMSEQIASSFQSNSEAIEKDCRDMTALFRRDGPLAVIASNMQPLRLGRYVDLAFPSS